MYKTVNRHGPEICKESFCNISGIHDHATRSAVKGNLFAGKTTSIAQQTVSAAGSKLRNMTPSAIRNAQSIETFKIRLKEHYLNLQKAQE